MAFLAYAVVLVVSARREPVGGARLTAFADIDAAWVVLSAAVLLFYWTEWTMVARLLTVARALVVEVFATLQFRPATAARRMELAV